MKKNECPIIVEETFNTLPRRVWQAITRLDQMHQWYFDNIPDFRAEVDFRTEFMLRNGDREFNHLWKVTKVIPEKLITYNWKYENYPGDSFVTFEVIEQNRSSRLKLTVEVTEDFPDDIPEFRRESCLAGWNYFIKERLKHYLEKD